jgi:putative aldouronate transport system substrate-binding protein
MKRTFLLVVSLIICGFVVFAGGGQQGGAAVKPARSLGPTTTGPTPWLAKYPSTVRFTLANSTSPGIKFPDGQNETDNVWTRAWKKELNVEAVTAWLSSNADYATKVNLAIASGDLPDVFSVNAAQFRDIVDSELAADITDYIPNNTSAIIKEVMEYQADVVDTARRDGRLYAMPMFGWGPMPMPQFLWIRHDWKESSGLPDPKSISDIENMIRKFMSDHPGSYGIALTKNLEEVIRMAPGWNAYPGNWITGPDGSIVYGSIQPAMKNALAAWADWYKKGYIRKDFMAADNDALVQDILNGRVGLHALGQWYGHIAIQLVRSNQGLDSYFECYDLPTVDGKAVIHPQPFDNGGYIVINKSAEYPDAILKCANFIMHIAYEAWPMGLRTMDDVLEFLGDGTLVHVMRSMKMVNPLDERNAYNQIQEFKKTGNIDVLTSSANRMRWSLQKLWVENRDPIGIQEWLQTYHDKGSYSVSDRIVAENRWLPDRMKGLAPVEDASYGSTLNDILIEGWIKIITGEEPVSYFDTLVNVWKSSGGDIVTAAVNRDYGKK